MDLVTLAGHKAIAGVEEREAQRKRDETQQRIADALERIADALEVRNYAPLSPDTSRTINICGNCGKRYPAGGYHICNSVRPTTAGSTYQP